MSDLTVYAEALISTVARAFYDDDAVCLVDVLIRDKFLRDDDMAPRLSLPAKKLRTTLQFLQDEHLVKYETVDDLAQGGSQATKFWYIDYNHAVHSIRLRLHLLRKQLEQAEMRARSSSFYLCPGYKDRRCNGRYTEEEAQQILDPESGMFLCQACYTRYEADPNAPDKSSYMLSLVDNTKDLRLAVDNMRRVNVQLSGKTIGNQQLRTGIYDLLQKIRGKGKQPITSNLPSENFALGIGSKRLAGTGRTANIQVKKLQKEGVATSATAAQDILVGGGKRTAEGSDLTFLKNAMGNEIAFSVEKGGAARANLLATRTRRRLKLMDAAATRVGASVPLDLQLEERKRRKLEEEAKKENGTQKTGVGKQSNIPLHFLDNNVGRRELDEEMDRLRQQDMEEDEEENDSEEDDRDQHYILSDDTEGMPNLFEEEPRMLAFQAEYAKEMARQIKVLNLEADANVFSSPPKASIMMMENDEPNIAWEDGDS
jgi:transcription initiation factor IIE alpha subunit